MPPTTIPVDSAWLNDAIRHLDMLFAEIADCVYEGDVLPTQEGLDAAKQVLIKCRHAHVPRIGLTVNGEFALAWKAAEDNGFRAYARPDGSVQFFRNKNLIDESTFTETVNRAAL